MKALQSTIFRALIAIVAGILLIQFRENATKWMTKAVGALFFLSGLFSCITYYVENKQAKAEPTRLTDDGREVMVKRPYFPIVGLGSMILGLVLTLMTESFISLLMYTLGGILILGAINQFFNLISARRYGTIPVLFWIFPAVLLLAAAFFISKPVEAMSDTLLLPLGWCFIFYGVVECVNSLRIHRARKEYEQKMKQIILQDEPEDAEVVEEGGRLKD